MNSGVFGEIFRSPPLSVIFLKNLAGVTEIRQFLSGKLEKSIQNLIYHLNTQFISLVIGLDIFV